MTTLLTRYVQLLAAYLRPQRTRTCLLAAILAASIVLQLVNPQVVGSFIDAARAGASGTSLIAAGVLFIAIALAQRACALVAVYLGENVGWMATNALRADLLRHCLHLDLPFHKTHTPGELIERLDGDVTRLAQFFSQLVIQVLGNVVLIGGIVVLLWRIDWRAGVVMVIYAVATVSILRTIQRRAVRNWGASRQASAEQFGFLEERLSGTEDIRANGGEAYVLNSLYGLLRRSMRTERSARLASNLTFLTINSLFVIGYGLGLAVGAYLFTHHQISIGTAYLIVYYIGMLSAPLDSVRRQIQNLQQATASIERVSTLLHLEPQVRDDGTVRLAHGPLGVAFTQVSFRYDDGNDQPGPDQRSEGEQVVLNDISLTVPSGRLLGLIGHTGSGKSTLVRLLYRLYEPTGGQIFIGGHDLRQIPLNEVRTHIGMVTQDVQLFQATVRDNLTFFDRSVTDDRIRQALTDVGLGDWLNRLPDGLETQLGAGGLGLSAGEAQLLAFARIFLRDPSVVILDEASSRLDPATERILERVIDRLFQGRTGIIIAHRLSTVQRANDIMILEQGRVVEYGPRDILAADSASRFSALLRTSLEDRRQEVLV